MSAGELPLDQLLPAAQSWDDPKQPASELPGGPGVILLQDVDGRPVQLLTAQQARRTVQARLAGQDAEEGPTLRADLSEVVRSVRWREVWSPFESRWWYYRTARALYPRDYRKMVSFGSVWFLHIDPARHPREIRVTDQVWQKDGTYIGPWNYHKEAQRALETMWDLFDLCRHPDQLRKTPNGRRCAYADMGRCDAPCDGSVPLDAMHDRTQQAWKFLLGETTAHAAHLDEEMRSHARGQRFEQAGQLKQQLDTIAEWDKKTRWRIGPDEEWNILAIIPATRRKSSRPYLFRRGVLQDGPLMLDRKLQDELPKWLAAALQQPALQLDPVQRMEQGWLMAHYLDRVERKQALIVHLRGLQRVPEDLPTRIEEYLEMRERGSKGAREQG